MARGDHDADLFNGLGKFIRLNGAVVVEIEVLEGLEEDGLFVEVATSLLGELGADFLFKATKGLGFIPKKSPDDLKQSILLQSD